MAQLKFGSAGVTAREIDISGPVTQQPNGIPAGIVGTSMKGPAFVPVTVGNLSDWYSKFGTTNGKMFGPLAVVEWLRNAQSVTYLRVLGAGDGRERDMTTGRVHSAGFTVGEEQPNDIGLAEQTRSICEAHEDFQSPGVSPPPHCSFRTSEASSGIADS